jgi:hypothetical protein
MKPRLHFIDTKEAGKEQAGIKPNRRMEDVCALHLKELDRSTAWSAVFLRRHCTLLVVAWRVSCACMAGRIY